jgi:hypothetical protein
MKTRIIIACSVFKTELDFLLKKGTVDMPVVYINSMLHMYPEKLKKELDEKIKVYSDYEILLLFGDCHARMIDYEKNKNITRTPGINCCEIFLGNKNYRELRKEGAFIMLHEWAERWEEIFYDYMGFKNSKMAALFMQDMHKKLVYIDTGIEKTDMGLLKEISDHLGLPVEIIKSDVDNLGNALNQTKNK